MKAATANRVARNGKHAETTPEPTPLELLASLDHAKLVEQREAIEARKAETVANFDREIEALRILEKAAYTRDHGKPERKKPQPRKAKAGHFNGTAGTRDPNDIEEKVRQYLAVAGKAKPAIIGADIKEHPVAVGHALRRRPDWFRQDLSTGEWRLLESDEE